jgi:hypothetical protein
MNAQAVLTPGGNSVRLCDAWSTVPRGRIFRDNVVTRLPYIEITSAKQWECDGVMMDEQRIMLTKVRDPALGRLLLGERARTCLADCHGRQSKPDATRSRGRSRAGGDRVDILKRQTRLQYGS